MAERRSRGSATCVYVRDDDEEVLPYEAAKDLCERVVRGDVMIGLLSREDMDEAAHGLAHAGRRGNAAAWMELAEAYAYGPFKKATSWPSALSFAEMSREEGSMALKCYAEAAALGDQRALWRFVVECFHEHASPDAMAFALALYEKRKHAGERLYPEAIHQVGLLRYHLGDHPGAFVAHTEAANRGDADALFELYTFYANGYGVPKDPEKAEEFLAKAAERGQSRALYNVGAAHAVGRAPYAKDMDKAIEHYRKAASNGSGRAAATLGVMHLMGDGLPLDVERAKQLFESAENKRFDVGAFLAQLGIARPS